jgi:uncharacterized membrane protein
VNLGGAVMPALLSAYLVTEVGHALRLFGVTARLLEAVRPRTGLVSGVRRRPCAFGLD